MKIDSTTNITDMTSKGERQSNIESTKKCKEHNTEVIANTEPRIRSEDTNFENLSKRSLEKMYVVEIPEKSPQKILKHNSRRNSPRVKESDQLRFLEEQNPQLLYDCEHLELSKGPVKESTLGTTKRSQDKMSKESKTKQGLDTENLNPWIVGFNYKQSIEQRKETPQKDITNYSLHNEREQPSRVFKDSNLNLKEEHNTHGEPYDLDQEDRAKELLVQELQGMDHEDILTYAKGLERSQRDSIIQLLQDVELRSRSASKPKSISNISQKTSAVVMSSELEIAKTKEDVVEECTEVNTEVDLYNNPSYRPPDYIKEIYNVFGSEKTQGIPSFVLQTNINPVDKSEEKSLSVQEYSVHQTGVETTKSKEGKEFEKISDRKVEVEIKTIHAENEARFMSLRASQVSLSKKDENTPLQLNQELEIISHNPIMRRQLKDRLQRQYVDYQDCRIDKLDTTRTSTSKSQTKLSASNDCIPINKEINIAGIKIDGQNMTLSKELYDLLFAADLKQGGLINALGINNQNSIEDCATSGKTSGVSQNYGNKLSDQKNQSNINKEEENCYQIEEQDNLEENEGYIDEVEDNHDEYNQEEEQEDDMDIEGDQYFNQDSQIYEGEGQIEHNEQNHSQGDEHENYSYVSEELLRNLNSKNDSRFNFCYNFQAKEKPQLAPILNNPFQQFNREVRQESEYVSPAEAKSIHKSVEKSDPSPINNGDQNETISFDWQNIESLKEVFNSQRNFLLTLAQQGKAKLNEK